ncbi:hypothetical protein UFOVP1492_131 [uncultured Caudovirales phage]|uniref:Uncharacterized protein n=1 Tax=uncultured Caudovirales phage TaxID=2100421 RepID=A0A6J7XJI4_9CAUD|nr:hypothetical protein UFOVP1127_3 [uncultured Caudovirales phage]CAB4193394.1 hypothetical protein UFOVP1242_71 [uncultured Caudovirales phage]CAB4217927.1 hypothetical protein UFOVP1492_131 [uncultured Caudovirales phage]CAB5231140.1 hypothetical protein UFOVP1580_24 [uncultured Caudovirales phage]
MLKIEHDGEPGIAAIYTKTTKPLKIYPEGMQVPKLVPEGSDVTIRPLLAKNGTGFGHCYCWYFMDDEEGEPVKYKVQRPWYKAVQDIAYKMPMSLEDVEMFLETDDACYETLTGEIVEPDGRDRFGFPPMAVMYGLF